MDYKKCMIVMFCVLSLAFTAYASQIGELKPKAVDLKPTTQSFTVELVGVSNDSFDGGKFKVIQVSNIDTHEKHTLVYHAGTDGESLIEIKNDK